MLIIKKSNEYKKIDVSLIFFIILSVAICIESYKLEIGTFSAAKAGTFPFFAGLILGILSVAQLLFDFLPQKVCHTIKILAYTLLMDKLGFFITTLFFIAFLLKVIESKSWLVVTLVAVSITLFTHLVFKVWLDVPLPKGVIGF